MPVSLHVLGLRRAVRCCPVLQVPFGALAAGESKSASIYYAAPRAAARRATQTLQCHRAAMCSHEAADADNLAELLHQAEAAHNAGLESAEGF